VVKTPFDRQLHRKHAPISTALRCSARKVPLARSRISAALTVPVKSKSSMSLASGSLAMVLLGIQTRLIS
jgi:hypothetical protein